MRRNHKLLLGLMLCAMVIYWLLIPKDTNTDIVAVQDNKIRHHVSFYTEQVKTNNTLFNEILSLEYHHPESILYIKQYLRPNETTTHMGVFGKSKNIVSDFDINFDVIVYLHIQKVGGTKFNQHLINDLVLEMPCQCKGDVLTQPCYCRNKNGFIWLFSWFTVGWPCGLHADWTMLTECVDDALNEIEGQKRKRRYFYITLLRDPILRYLSEWKHQRQGQHWEASKLRCGGEHVSLFNVQPCFTSETWKDVSLDEFMACRTNLATNRQTRMTADLTLSKCYHRNLMKEDQRGKLQLKSALDNLGHIAFFGLTEFQTETQKLFEQTFNLKFKINFQHLNEESGDELISTDEFVNLMKYIELDIQLYQNTKQLFLNRVKDL